MASYPETHLTMKTSPRQTLSGKVPENLIRVARRRTAGRRGGGGGEGRGGEGG